MEEIKIWSKAKGIIFDLIDWYRERGQAPPLELKLMTKIVPTTPEDIIEEYQLEMAEFGLALL